VTIPSPARQEPEERLATLVGMAQQSPEDAEIAPLIRVIRSNPAAHGAKSGADGQRLINTTELADYHIQRRRPHR